MKGKVIVATILVLVIAICSFLVYYTGGRWWTNDGSVSIAINGQPEKSLSAYKGPSGEVLIRLSQTATETSDYIYYPDLKEVGVLSSSTQFIYLPGVAFCKDSSPATIMLSDRVKVENDKNVIFGTGFVEFTSLDGLRTRIDL